MSHLDTQKHYPSSGWGYHWTGDPNKGFGTTQPGGWMFNLLPYIEQGLVHDMALGLAGTSSSSGGSGLKAQMLARMNGTVIPTYNCPSRRSGSDVLIKTVSLLETEYNADDGSKGTFGQARADYAGNAGTNQQVTTGNCFVPSGSPYDSNGYDGADYFKQQCYDAKANGWWSPDMNGVTYACSRITLKKITDGTTKTFFAGEKSLQPQFYLGGGPTDNGALYEGHDWDVLRWGGQDNLLPPPAGSPNGNIAANNATIAVAAANPADFLTPLEDKNDSNNDWGEKNFGSAHNTGSMFVMCDGSVQMIAYTVDPQIFWKLCNRRDGLDVQLP